MKKLDSCCNGDGRPVKAPSKVLCEECMKGLTIKMEKFRQSLDRSITKNAETYQKLSTL